ncbi:hypothetical protein CAEBREN_07857 [Caenorhabditis brenneri]|uniref:Uncharacterized protein n=1 Tax=Caenorhabditis brenneri TaxID=135651 RepID=G0PDI6_CAEBE|nr:hypothetical protein CAEBREN_07857 [Caenorhabditis brenneri]
MGKNNPTLLISNYGMEMSGGEPNQARNLPQDLPFGFNPRVPPPPLYQDVWNLNCVPLLFDSDQAGAPAPIRDQAPASEEIIIQDTYSQQSVQKTPTPYVLLPGINTLPGIKIFSRKNRPFPEPVHFYKLPEDQHASFNKYLHAPPEGYRHTLPPDPKIPKFGAPLLPKEPYIEPQYDVKEESFTQSIVDILFPEARSFWNREAQKPKPSILEFEAPLFPRQPQDGPNESHNILSPDFDSMHNIDTQEPKQNVPELGAPSSTRGPQEEPQDNAPSVDESPSQEIAQGVPNGDSEETEQLTRSNSKNEQYQCSNCKKFTKKIVGKKTKEPEHWICRICYFKDYNKKQPRYRTSTK